MTTLQLGSAGQLDLDLACAVAGAFRLWRRAGAVCLTVDDRHVPSVRRALALRGVGTTPCDGNLTEPTGLVAAIGIGLAPARLNGPDEIDVLDVRVVPLSDATARLTRRFMRVSRLGGRRRIRCRGLLRESDALLEIRRSAWCGGSTLGGARRALRPVLFDRTATPSPLQAYAADGVITRWING